MKNQFKILIVLAAFISGLYSCTTTTTIYLVRHAEKRNDSDTSTLTPNGSRRAIALCDTIRNKGIDSIFASTFIRTQLTAKPTSDLLGINISLYNPENSIAFAKRLKAFNGKNVLVSGHSDNIPLIIQEITGRQVNIPHNVFNKLFIIKIRRGTSTRITLRESTYGSPSP